jgi:hypothetical protein
VSFHGRLARLKRLEGRALPDGRCPGCGFRPDDIRTVVVRLSPPRPADAGSDWQPTPLYHRGPDDTNQPGRPRCERCGGWARLEIIDNLPHTDPDEWPEE